MNKFASKEIVYTNRTVSFVHWCDEVQKKFKLMGASSMDENSLAAKHAYELGYTPDSWVREVSDKLARRNRVNEFKKFNP